jgi:hypothetical protein
MKRGWHILQDEGRYTLSRRLPVRFDIEAITDFPPLDPARLARQIRQDVWRQLKNLRGFSPVVEIMINKSGVTVRAGGQLVKGASVPSGLNEELADLLSDPARRARWSNWAAPRSRSRT